MSVPVFIAATDICRAVQLVFCSLDPVCRARVWPQSPCKTVTLAQSYPKTGTHCKAFKSNEPLQRTTGKKAQLNPFFTRVQLLRNFAL